MKLKEALDARGVDIKDVLNALIDVHQNSQMESDEAVAQQLPITTVEQLAHSVYKRQVKTRQVSLYKAYDKRYDMETALVNLRAQVQGESIDEETVSI